MRASNGALLSVAVLLLAVAANPGSARAGIVETIVDYADTVIGTITFPTFTGDSAAGVALSVDGFTQADITSISWTIDPSTYAVTALDLEAFKGNAGCNAGSAPCSNTTLTLTEDSVEAQLTRCPAGEDFCLFGSAVTNGPVTFTVPEPSTWAMMIVGFAGLAFAGYRARGSAHAPA